MGSGETALRIIRLAPRIILDTHIVVRWLAEPVALSAVTLLELAVLLSARSLWIKVSPAELFGEL